MKLKPWRTLGHVNVLDARGTVLGVDQSYTATGLCRISRDGLLEATTASFPPSDTRQADIYAGYGRLLQDSRPTFAAIEGYAHGAKVGVALSGELGGILRLCHQVVGVPLHVYPPTNVKQFLTGSGAAKKPVMLKALYASFGYDVDDDNECDAVAIALMEAGRVGRIELTKARMAAVLRQGKTKEG